MGVKVTCDQCDKECKKTTVESEPIHAPSVFRVFMRAGGESEEWRLSAAHGVTCSDACREKREAKHRLEDARRDLERAEARARSAGVLE